MNIEFFDNTFGNNLASVSMCGVPRVGDTVRLTNTVGDMRILHVEDVVWDVNMQSGEVSATVFLGSDA
jgi:hypothetical protein